VRGQLVDLRRGIDYLATRTDLDLSRLAYFKPSAGGYTLMPPAIDRRYKSVILHGGGIWQKDVDTHVQANHIDFVQLIDAPTLLIHGRQDECSNIATNWEPLGRLLRCKTESHDYEGGHYCPPEILMPIINPWLDKTLGPVTSQPEE
jgi:hypothetical protein